MTRTDLIAAAARYALTVEIVDDEVHVTGSGVRMVEFRYEAIEAGAEYLGTVRAPAAPLGTPVLDLPRTVRFA